MKRILSAAAAGRLKRHLKKGGLLAYPTESCYGLGCLPDYGRALHQLMRLKRRPQHKGMIVVGDKLERLLPLLQGLTAADRNALKQNWPAAKTFLLPAAARVQPLLRGRGRNKLAVRVPAHSAARDLCAAIGQALVSTSCNRAGKRPCKTAREARRQFGRQVWIIGGRCGSAKKPSSIIDWETGQNLR
ncbi:MAG: L-threonylcarbamoyladenylate synthase [Neisseria sp.]|nr:L-threonylcarbamoyladenylate synthase [Neisseria sp.]